MGKQRSVQLNMTRDDWEVIAEALHYRQQAAIDSEDEERAEDIAQILNNIGDEGQDAAATGVSPSPF